LLLAADGQTYQTYEIFMIKDPNYNNHVLYDFPKLHLQQRNSFDGGSISLLEEQRYSQIQGPPVNNCQLPTATANCTHVATATNE